jgi:hypothetical protein
MYSAINTLPWPSGHSVPLTAPNAQEASCSVSYYARNHQLLNRLLLLVVVVDL